MSTRVACIRARDNSESLDALLNLFDPSLSSRFSGCRVLIKPNFNSPHRYPASTDLRMLSALVNWLQAAGAAEITIGESCGLRWGPAEEVFRRIGIRPLAEQLGVRCVNFDDGPWREVNVGGTHLKKVSLSEELWNHDRLVYLTCLKTHRSARFSISLKHALGFLPPPQRRDMHRGDLEEKIAELNLAVKPDLIVVDARKCFVAGGPAIGWVRKPGLLMAGTDRVALDVEGVKVLASYFSWNRLLRDPWTHPHISRAAALGLGARSNAEINVVKG